MNAGTYTLSESGGPAGYTASAWSCTAGTFTGASSGVAAQHLCHLHDQQQRPARALTLTKVVDAAASGSGKVAADWTLTATPNAIPGQSAVSGNGDPTSAAG